MPFANYDNQYPNIDYLNLEIIFGEEKPINSQRTHGLLLKELRFRVLRFFTLYL